MPDKSQEDAKARVLTKSRSSITTSIADAVVAKSVNLFLLSERDGDMPSGERHGYGLYYSDCRYLNQYKLSINGQALNSLAATSKEGTSAKYYLVNHDFKAGDTMVPKESLGLKLERHLDGEAMRMHETLDIDNFTLDKLQLELTIELGADFSDIYAVRGMITDHPGSRQPTEVKKDRVAFVYRGADDRTRRLKLRFDPAPGSLSENAASFTLDLKPRGSTHLEIDYEVDPGEGPNAPVQSGGASRSGDPRDGKRQGKREDWFENSTQVIAGGSALEKICQRSLRDLAMLRSDLRGRDYISAGVPWFATLFGRDSIVAAIEMLVFAPRLAEETMDLLARYQGQKQHGWTEEAPGKILHEIRTGELASIHEIPYTPYYGSVDATPLFILLCTHHAAWTGRTDLFEKFERHIDAALTWIDKYADSDGDGFIDYAETSEGGLINEGWKDSSDAMVNEAGHEAKPPIAPIEAQGYVYAAKLQIARLYEMKGDKRRADKLRKEAGDLKQRINQRYWLEDKGFYAMALANGGEPLRVLSSNPAQLMWTGAADHDKAAKMVDKLLGESMFTGWGIRTLAEDEKGYNPVSYHRGSVWPHDNAIAFAGMQSYGFSESMCVFQGIIDAGTHYEEQSLPELFGGFARSEYPVPVRYPVACHPQAWAAGSVPFMLQASLGLEPDAHERRLKIRRPALPPSVDELELRRLSVGKATCDLLFRRSGPTSAEVKVLTCTGELDIALE